MDIHNHFEYTLKKHGEKTAESRITFEIKSHYYLELFISETIELLGSTESKTTKDANGKNVLLLEITEVVLIHCNIVNNNFQQDQRVLYAFVLNKSFGQLVDI